MSVFGTILCAFGRHKPIRRNVRWDGLNYVGECRRCGAQIQRISHHNWRKAEGRPDDVASDST